MQVPNIVPDSKIVQEPNPDQELKITPLNETFSELPDDLFRTIHDWLSTKYSLEGNLNYFTSVGIVLSVTFVAAVAVHMVARRILVTIIRRSAK